MISERVHVLELRSVRGTGGGPEKTILLGAARANRSRLSVTVCYIRDARDQDFGVCTRAEGLGVDYVEVVERGSFDPSIWRKLQHIVRERAIDIVHAHDYKTNLLALLLSRAEGTIPLTTAHGWTGHSRRERVLYYPADKRMIRAFPLTIAVSSEIRSELLRHHVSPDCVRVVLNGIDHRAFRRDRGLDASARAHLGISPDDVVIGSIGRLEPQKRFDLLIRACAALRERWPRLRLFIAGAGSLHGDLQTLAAQLLPDGVVRLLGHQADIGRLHHAFDLFVQSSDYEGTPNAVLEAMAFETPIVATAAGGTAEIVHDGIHGRVVPCGDVSALTAAIERTWREPAQMQRHVLQARRRVETILSFDQRMATVEAIYDELADRFRQRLGRRASERYA